MAADARGRMVETMGLLLQEKGYQATGMNELIARSGAPRGSIYYYFPDGKEQIAAEAIDASGRQAAAATSQALASKRTAAAGLRALIDWLADALESSGFTYGCPIATTTLEMASESQIVQRACSDAYARWQSAIADRLVADGMNPRRANGRASLVLASLEGALVLSRAQQDTACLRALSSHIGILVSPA